MSETIQLISSFNVICRASLRKSTQEVRLVFYPSQCANLGVQTYLLRKAHLNFCWVVRSGSFVNVLFPSRVIRKHGLVLYGWVVRKPLVFSLPSLCDHFVFLKGFLRQTVVCYCVQNLRLSRYSTTQWQTIIMWYSVWNSLLYSDKNKVKKKFVFVLSHKF